MALDIDFKSQPHLLRWEDNHFLNGLSSSPQSFVPNQICWRREGASKVKHVLFPLLYFLLSPFAGQFAKREERRKHRIFVTRSIPCAISDSDRPIGLVICKYTKGRALNRNVSWADFSFAFIERVWWNLTNSDLCRPHPLMSCMGNFAMWATFCYLLCDLRQE